MLQLPENDDSYWRSAYTVPQLYPELTEELWVDVAVVGAGISGLTSAYLLKEAGKTVAVIDKHTVGGGTTGRTTGKVTSQHGVVYADLIERFGEKKARLYGEANQAAIEEIARIVATEGIECNWHRDDNYVFTVNPKRTEQFEREAAAAQQLGLPASLEQSTSLPFEISRAVKFEHQASFHSVEYVMGLAKAIDGQGSYVFEHTAANGIREGTPGYVRTRHSKIRAQHIIITSSVPTLPLVARGGYALFEYPSESYIIAGITSSTRHGMYISPDKHHYSILPIHGGDEEIILIGGEGHFWGMRGNRQARLQRLADYAETHFGVTQLLNKWSDRDYISYDGIPLIGKLYPWSKRLYVGTAFRKWGLTGGTVAGMLLRDHILGVENPWDEVFHAMRTSPIKSIPHALFN